MPADDEGKLIAYKWRKSAILETPTENFFYREGEAHIALFPDTPHLTM